ncbi:hypothetical protein O4220_05940 [Rhodococcus ruber]|uniref:Glycosyltransferase family 1 protein n=1 Tax=Rhodococcus ruber TaxID=1830 RepID=A0ABT4MAQ6_9NOCA|nr:hypothetical protein [Rhodococcus ruber]MCZ4518053.1 hypothetical protein [Rhodococcus ruber]
MNSNRILLVSNERAKGGEAGFRDALARLEDQGLIDSWLTLAPRVQLEAGLQWDSVYPELVAVRKEFRPTTILIMSPKSSPWTEDQVHEFSGNAEVIYWEGDPWESRSKFTHSMTYWAKRSDRIYTVAGGSQALAFKSYGAQDVRLILHTYCQVQNKKMLTWQGRELDRTSLPDVVTIANRQKLLRPGRPVPGAAARAVSISQMLRSKKANFEVYGENWRGKSARGKIPYELQIPTLRRGLISANWDHYPKHFGYASDRLPISLLAGRVHVTTGHLGMEWLDELAEFVTLVDRPLGLRHSVEGVLERGPKTLLHAGRNANRWVKDRMSDVEALNFMLKDSILGVDNPPSDPWARLPTLNSRLATPNTSPEHPHAQRDSGGR